MIRLFRAFADFIKIIFLQRYLIFSLAKRQIKQQFVGSLLGFFWTFVNPLVMIFIFWFVFGVGFKAQPSGNVPFVVWLTCGMAVWTAFNEIVSGSLNVIIENQSLIKKTLIQSHILPVSKIFSTFVTHMIFLALLIVLLLSYGLPFNLYFLQFMYYFVSMSVLALGIGWFSSSVNVFVRDMGPFVNVLLQFLFWMTPIMWDLSIIPGKWHIYLKLNPVFYLVQGYRDSFLYSVPFWEHMQMTLYYWSVTAAFFIIGGIVFRKAKPHFADVL